MTTEDFKAISSTIPRQPGIYRFMDADDTILYIGKAKNLFKRLSSYFGEKKDRAYKTHTMVKHAHHITFTIVETEADALLLENSLIKKHQPRYNVSLKDGKSYSYLCIKKEPFSRVFITRKLFKDGSVYFGPYTSKARLKIILELIKQLFPLRTCKLNLSPENIEAGKFKVCLEYHIKNCLGPCEGYESATAYEEKIQQVKNILKGNFGAVKTHFKREMQVFAAQMEFEKAQQIKEKLDVLEDYQSKSTVVSHTIADVDVFSIACDEKSAFVHYMKIVDGALINMHTQELIKNLDDDEVDLLAFVIPEIRMQFNSIAPEIIVPMEVPITDPNIKVVVPKIGDKKKLLELSEKNINYFLMQKREDDLKMARTDSSERILKTLQSDLNMDVLPEHIECFDNSNIQGTNPVAACVVFKQGKPSKKDYRHFNVKTVEGPNDFASMEEIVFRRYRRLLDEDEPLPQLVIIDGGKGQLGAAMKSIKKLGVENQFTVIGIAKRLEEIYFPGDSIPVYLNKKSESLKLIQQARNEAHWFAITFHRDQRSKNFLGTEITDIPGVGEKSAQKLLSHFGSVKKLRQATVAEISEVVGMSLAKKVVAHFSDEMKSSTAPSDDIQ